MKIKVAASSPKSAGIRRGSLAGPQTVLPIVLIAVIDVMFASRLAVAQQVAFKAGRAPRIYNVLLTTDQRLLPSQADPIVAPVFRPFPYFYNGWPEVYAAGAAVPQPAVHSAGVAAAAASAAAVPNVPSTSEAESSRSGDDGPPQPPQPQPAAVIKNNKPADTSVPDVPPPPLPVSRAGATGEKDKKRPEEFPPPPVSFAI